MHIKQITISNFRSFRRQGEVHPFHSGLNSVVGRNGSGKSNLFDAVQFVLLSPRFYTLRQEERQALLHEGSGSAAVNAFVEIVFDNSDHRFALENSDEVVLRRTVGHKKDEFFLQRKRANKNEIMSLLEGAGFSKSNPYFIVQQGKVHALCTMTNPERLALLKQVAGTTVYDEKKQESLAKMQENTRSIEKIAEMLESIEEKLEELSGQKEELTQYQQLDRDRRAMEYTLYDLELRKARHDLDAIEHRRADGNDALAALHEQAKETHNDIRNCEALQKSKTNALRRNRILMERLEQDKTQAVTHETQLELSCKELQESLTTHQEIQQQSKQALQKLQGEINKAQEKLDTDIGPKYDTAAELLTNYTTERDEAKNKMESLYAKQGRTKQFSTREARDEYLASHVQELQLAKTEKTAQIAKHQDKLGALQRQTQADTQTLEALQQDEITSKTALLQSLVKTCEEKKKRRLELHEQRRDEWRKLEEWQEQVQEGRETVRKTLGDLRKVMPRATSMGLDALEHVILPQLPSLERGKHYFGMVLDNMELVHEKYQTAVEVAAQNSLFHVIVDTDATAAALMKRLEQEKLGRVTFLPLNRLVTDQGGNHAVPDSPDVTSLLDTCIRYDAKVEVAMRHVFSKKLLARNVDVASTWSTRCKMDAITLEGDLCSRKGALTGGYVDAQKSRFRAHVAHHQAKTALRQVEKECQAAKRKAQDIDQTATNLMGELQRLEAKQADLKHILADLERKAETLQHDLASRTTHMDKLRKTDLPSLERDVDSLDKHVERLQEEMKTDLTASLTDEERATLQELKALQQELTQKVEQQGEVVDQLGVERQGLTSLLQDNLLKKKEELLQQANSAAATRTSSDDASPQDQETLKQRQLELDDARRITQDVEAKLAESRKENEELRSELLHAKNEFEKFKSKDLKNQRALEEAQEDGERLLNKRSICVAKREDYVRKIQDLGSLPPTSELANYTDLSISALTRQLVRVNKELKKYPHVNKKAYDQYVNFFEQRENLLKRKEELDKGAESVKELVESLDRQKDEAIQRTFRGVSAHFKDVFQELVPHGAGELVMKTALDDDDDDKAETGDGESDDDKGDSQESSSDKPDHPSVSMYRGIGIKVRFSAVGENYIMSQLSGGQKALVAMALIFAIQRCDPAPFYLFDELDQALDSTYRAAVASLIERQANSTENPTQFIVSTFRPELVAVAHRCYGISHQNKVSNIHHLSKKDALHFIANLMSEEEAVGEVTTLASSRVSRKSGSASKKRKSIAQDTVEDDASSLEEEEDAEEEEEVPVEEAGVSP